MCDVFGITEHVAKQDVNIIIKTKLKRWLRKIANGILDFEEQLLSEGIPEDWKRVDYTVVIEALTSAFPYAVNGTLISDRYYYLPTLDDVFEFLEMDETDKETYVSEFHDCDDFSFRLMGQFHRKPWSAAAIGIAWSHVHAYNFVVAKIDEDEYEVFIIESQTDQLIRPVEAGDSYKTEFIIL